MTLFTTFWDDFLLWSHCKIHTILYTAAHFRLLRCHQKLFINILKIKLNYTMSWVCSTFQSSFCIPGGTDMVIFIQIFYYFFNFFQRLFTSNNIFLHRQARKLILNIHTNMRWHVILATTSQLLPHWNCHVITFTKFFVASFKRTTLNNWSPTTNFDSHSAIFPIDNRINLAKKCHTKYRWYICIQHIQPNATLHRS